MKDLLYYEIRKMMSLKIFIIVSVLVLVIPMLISYSWLPSTYEQEYQEQYRGVVSKDWLEPIQKEQEAMQQEEMEFEQAHLGSLIPEPRYSQISVVRSAANMGETVLNKRWRDYEAGNASGFKNDKVYHADRIAYVSEKMEAVEIYRFGDTRGASFITMSIFAGAVIIGVYMIYLMSRIFNRENQGQFLDLMKSTKQGKRNIGKIKIAIVVSYPILFTLFACLVYVILGILIFHPDFSIHVLSSGYINPFTYGEQVFYAILLSITGVSVVSFLAATLSLWIKSTFQSLGAAIILYLLPFFLPRFVISGFPIMSFLPTNFMILMDTVQYDPYLFIRDKGFITAQLIPMVYIVILSMVTIILYKKFQHTAKY